VNRGQRRTARLLSGSGLPESKTLSSLDEGKLPVKARRQLPALIEVRFVDRATNIVKQRRDINNEISLKAILHERANNER
jgi:hypothetical protein